MNENERKDCSAERSSETPAAAGRESPLLRTLFRQQGSFNAVADDALEQLEAMMHPLRFRDDEIICEEGDPGGWIFVVTLGEVEVVKTARDGAMIQVNVLRPGNWGGIMSLFSDMPRSARLVARGNVELHAIDQFDLARLLETEPSVAMGLLACMSRRVSDDAIHLAATTRYVSVAEPEQILQRCSPDERLMLDTIRHRVAVAESLGEIMDFLFESLRQDHDCDRMSLLFLEEGGSRVASYWTRALYDALILPADYKEDVSGSVLQVALNKGGPQIANDLPTTSDEQRYSTNRALRRLVREGLRSSIATPLIVGGKPIGFLVQYSRKFNAYTDHHAFLHQAVASSIAPAVEKAYRIEQLTQANSYYTEVLGFVSHELQSPIASMVTDAKLLVAGYLGEMPEAQRTKLKRLIGKGNYLLTLVRDFLNLARLEDATLTAQFRPDVDLRKEVIDPVIEMCESDAVAKGMVLDYQIPKAVLRIECDPGLLRIAFGNLMTNAVKYGREGGRIRIEMTTDKNQVRLTVWNEGVGFAERQRINLFRKFVRLDDPELRKQKGTGVGLYSTWRIMQLHHGHVRANSQPGQWAEFTLMLPVGRGDEVDVG